MAAWLPGLHQGVCQLQLFTALLDCLSVQSWDRVCSEHCSDQAGSIIKTLLRSAITTIADASGRRAP